MKSIYLNLIFFTLLLGGCTSWKDVMIAKGDHTDAVKNSIYDFLHSGDFSKHDSVFSIRIINVCNNILGISIGANDNKLLPGPDDKIGSNNRGFPTKYFEHDGKLFYWHDSTSFITKDLINILSKYHRIDSLNVNGFIGIPETSAHIDHSKKGAHYYFCRDNLIQYKKVYSKAAMGYYEPPKFKCKCNNP